MQTANRPGISESSKVVSNQVENWRSSEASMNRPTHVDAFRRPMLPLRSSADLDWNQFLPSTTDPGVT